MRPNNGSSAPPARAALINWARLRRACASILLACLLCQLLVQAAFLPSKVMTHTYTRSASPSSTESRTVTKSRAGSTRTEPSQLSRTESSQLPRAESPLSDDEWTHTETTQGELSPVAASHCSIPVLRITPRVTVMPLNATHPGFGAHSHYTCQPPRSELVPLNGATVRLHPFQPFLSCEGAPDDSLMRQNVLVPTSAMPVRREHLVPSSATSATTKVHPGVHWDPDKLGGAASGGLSAPAPPGTRQAGGTTGAGTGSQTGATQQAGTRRLAGALPGRRSAQMQAGAINRRSGAAEGQARRGVNRRGRQLHATDILPERWSRYQEASTDKDSWRRGERAGGDMGRREGRRLHKRNIPAAVAAPAPSPRSTMAAEQAGQSLGRRDGLGGATGMSEPPATASAGSSPLLPTLGAWGSCAVVLSGGSLLRSSCGGEIDGHDTIIRFNAPPVAGFEPDVGGRTDVALINWKLEQKLVSAFHNSTGYDATRSTQSNSPGGFATQPSGFGPTQRAGASPDTSGPDDTRADGEKTGDDALFGRDPPPRLVVLTDDYLGAATRDADCREFRDTLGHPTLVLAPTRYSSAVAMLREMLTSSGREVHDSTLPSLGFRGVLTSLQFCRSVSIYGISQRAGDGHYWAPGDPMWSDHDTMGELMVMQKWGVMGSVDVEVYDQGPPCPEPFVYGMHANDKQRKIGSVVVKRHVHHTPDDLPRMPLLRNKDVRSFWKDARFQGEMHKIIMETAAAGLRGKKKAGRSRD